jgi:hypothetical protein
MGRRGERKMKDKFYIEPMPGDYVTPDGWGFGEKLREDDGAKDSSFPGCQFRIPSRGGELAVNIKVTGNPVYDGGRWKSRCRIEWVGDGEPSTFSGGAIWTDCVH